MDFQALFHLLWKGIIGGLFLAMLASSFVGTIYFKALSQPLRLIVIFCIFGLLSESSLSLMAFFGVHNLELVPFIHSFEYFIISFMYYNYLFGNEEKRTRVIMWLIGGLVVGFNIFSYVLVSYSEISLEYGKVIANLAIIGFSGKYIINSLSDISREINKELLQLNGVILGYYSFNLIIFSSINFLLKESMSLSIYFWFAHAVNNLIFMATLGYFLWKHGRNQRRLQFG